MTGFEQVRRSERTVRQPPVHPGGRRTGASLVTLVVLELLLALAAVGGAIALATDAIDLGASTAELPFGSPVFAACALLVVNAVLPTIVAIGALRRATWADGGHVVVGLALAGWILVQVAFIGWVSWLQTGCLVYGVAIAGLGTWRLLDR